jgi:hypothetical protein
LERGNIKTEKCDLNKSFGNYRSYFEKVPDINLHYCATPGANDLNVVNQFGGIYEYVFLAHYYLKCTNNTSLNKTNCKPQQEIDSALASIYAEFITLEYSLDHKKAGSPGSLYTRSDLSPVSTSITTRLWYYITNVDYYSDFGFLFEDIKKESFFYYSKPVSTYSLSGCNFPGCFASIVITMDGKFEKYTKTYAKLQNFLANVGGILKGVLFCAETISYLFNTKMYHHELITSIFKIDTENKCDDSLIEDSRHKSELK